MSAAAADTRHLSPLRHVLLGLTAHVNYDLPQSLVAVIVPKNLAGGSRPTATVGRRERDHQHVDDVLATRVPAEDAALAAFGRTWTERGLAPLNRLGTKRAADLRAPGLMLLKLAVRGFGVRLPAEPPGSR